MICMFQELRNQYKEFIYESFQVEETPEQYTVTYHYCMNELSFFPQIVVEKEQITNQNIDRDFLNYLFFQYGLFDLMNYYKLTCSPKIIIRPMKISKEQCEFFKKVLYHGLGEYFYKNGITLSYQEFVEFEVEATKEYSKREIDGDFSGNLIPVGGGKDSIVTLELLKEYRPDNKVFMLERNLYPKNQAGYDSIQMAGYQEEDIIIFKNNLDLKLLELNKKGYLNGHIPFSACLSMASFLMAYLTNKKYIVLSNEASANEGNVQGMNINHQYSKSYEYERDFREYTKKYLTEKIEYFSLLRCLNEYEIVQEFLKHKKYLRIFRSCNVGTKENVWCNHCSKCLYVYIMLYPHLTTAEMKQVFSNEMLDDASLEEIFKALVLEDVDKPFECVGEKKEINYSLQKAVELKKDHLPYLLEKYNEYPHPKISSEEIEHYFNHQHFIPIEYLKLVRRSL